MDTAAFLDRLHHELLTRAVAYFFPESVLERREELDSAVADLVVRTTDDHTVVLEWLGARHVVRRHDFRFTDHDVRLLRALGRYLGVRHRVAREAPDDAVVFRLFGGRTEDHLVSAWLDDAASGDTPTRTNAERIDDAVDVLRTCALGTYENRRITMGVLLVGALPDPFHQPPRRSVGAIRYARPLTAIRTFRRLSDGLQTVGLVDAAGLLTDIADVREWARPFAHQPLPAPVATAYATHARATLCGGHVCLVLTPNGEIKVFANGAHAFAFLDGTWRLINAAEKHRTWRGAIERPALADLLFSVALDLSEDRRGGLLVVLDDPAGVHTLVAAPDLLGRPVPIGAGEHVLKHHLHYLLQNTRALDLAPSVLETIGRIDGAVVLDRDANLLAFGAIVRHPGSGDTMHVTEGGRSTAAVTASRAGSVLKISEDGLVSFYRHGRRVWEM